MGLLNRREFNWIGRYRKWMAEWWWKPQFSDPFDYGAIKKPTEETVQKLKLGFRAGYRAGVRDQDAFRTSRLEMDLKGARETIQAFVGLANKREAERVEFQEKYLKQRELHDHDGRALIKAREWNKKLVEAIGPYDSSCLSPVGAIHSLRENNDEMTARLDMAEEIEDSLRATVGRLSAEVEDLKKANREAETEFLKELEARRKAEKQAQVLRDVQARQGEIINDMLRERRR